MTPFMIFFIVLTLGYILYYAAIITIDLHAKPKDGSNEVEEVDTDGMVPEGTEEDAPEETATEMNDDNENDDEESSVTIEEENDGDEPTGEDDDPHEQSDEGDDNVYNIPDEDDAPPFEEQPHEFAVEAMPEEEVPEVVQEEQREEEVPELTEEQKKEILPDEPTASPESQAMAEVINNSGEPVMPESPDAVSAEELLSDGFMDSVRDAAESDYALTPQIDKT